VVLDAELDDQATPGVRLATMHRVKGLEFDHVIVVAANDGTLPLPAVLSAAGDEAERQRLEVEERSLLYVAATRARQQLYILSFGAPSSFIADLGGHAERDRDRFRGQGLRSSTAITRSHSLPATLARARAISGYRR